MNAKKTKSKPETIKLNQFVRKKSRGSKRMLYRERQRRSFLLRLDNVGKDRLESK